MLHKTEFPPQTPEKYKKKAYLPNLLSAVNKPSSSIPDFSPSLLQGEKPSFEAINMGWGIWPKRPRASTVLPADMALAFFVWSTPLGIVRGWTSLLHKSLRLKLAWKCAGSFGMCVCMWRFGLVEVAPIVCPDQNCRAASLSLVSQISCQFWSNFSRLRPVEDLSTSYPYDELNFRCRRCKSK